MNNDLNQIRIFVKVAQLSSFTQAAEVLQIEKSTVSSKIKQLESQLNIRLLQRTTRSVQLTDAGRQYLSYCLKALDMLAQGDDFINELRQEPSGLLRVSFPQNLLDVILEPVVFAFMEKYPKVQLHIEQSNEYVDVIKSDFDIAICPGDIDLADSSMIYRQLFTTQWGIFASTELLKKHPNSTALQLMTQLPFISNMHNMSTQNKSTMDSIQLQNQSQNQKIQLTSRFTVNDGSAVIKAVKANLGIAVLPRSMVQKQVAQGEFQELVSDIVIEDSALYLIYPSRSGQPAKVKAFIEIMLDWAQKKSNV